MTIVIVTIIMTKKISSNLSINISSNLLIKISLNQLIEILSNLSIKLSLNLRNHVFAKLFCHLCKSQYLRKTNLFRDIIENFRRKSRENVLREQRRHRYRKFSRYSKREIERQFCDRRQSRRHKNYLFFKKNFCLSKLHKRFRFK